MVATKSLRNQYFDGTANELLASVTKKCFYRRVYQADFALLTHHNHCSGSRLQHLPRMLFRLLSLSNVKHNTHPARAVVVGFINGPASRCNPSFAALGNHRAKFIFKRVPSPLCSLDLSNDSGPVVGMNAAK